MLQFGSISSYLNLLCSVNLRNEGEISSVCLQVFTDSLNIALEKVPLPLLTQLNVKTSATPNKAALTSLLNINDNKLEATCLKHF